MGCSAAGKAVSWGWRRPDGSQMLVSCKAHRLSHSRRNVTSEAFRCVADVVAVECPGDAEFELMMKAARRLPRQARPIRGLLASLHSSWLHHRDLRPGEGPCSAVRALRRYQELPVYP